jgi:hypothetical protein
LLLTAIELDFENVNIEYDKISYIISTKKRIVI